MRIFIGWSGDLSHRVAVLVKEWLSDVLQSDRPFVSSEDIKKGARWSSELAAVLKECSFGIFCVVPSNARAPWMNFEAGAIVGAMPTSRVSTFLFGVDQSVIQDTPLSMFQSTVYEETDLLRLVRSINDLRVEDRMDETRLKRNFGAFWPRLKSELDELLLDAARQPSRADPDRRFSSDVERRLSEATDDWWKHHDIAIEDALFRHIAGNLGDFVVADRQLGFLAVVASYKGEKMRQFTEIAKNNSVVIQALVEHVAFHEHKRPVWRAAAMLERCDPEMLGKRLAAALAGQVEGDERRHLLSSVIPERRTYAYIEAHIESEIIEAEREKSRKTLADLRRQLGEPPRAPVE
ncbi:MAG: toll/interleukin-1 receptor domain-containing protein [Candidatus Eisenbacteria bacterium]|nr:toll/interleukin-1 receptor domain-containing protein [Candidatus Eisenbacteria bacterium]